MEYRNIRVHGQQGGLAFLRYEDLGSGLAAVFRVREPATAPRDLALTRGALEMRIRNGDLAGDPCPVERAALANWPLPVSSARRSAWNTIIQSGSAANE